MINYKPNIQDIMSIEKKLEEWAQATIDDYKKEKCSFYTQSPLNQIQGDNIKLLVLGINPGSNMESFEEMRNKDGSLWKDLLKDGMTPKVFLQGNPYFNERNKWRFWMNLSVLLDKANMKELINDYSSFVYTNIFLGSSKKASDITTERFDELISHTFKLINILKPTRIVCLGQIVMDAVLDKLVDDENEKACYVEDLPIRYKKINGIRVFGFHHPAFPYTRQEKDLVGKFLEYYDENDMQESNVLPPDDELQLLAEKYRDRIKNKRSSSVSKIILNYTELINKLKDKLKELGLELHKENDNHYWISTENNLRITIRCDKGTTNVGIRRSSYQGGGWVTEEMKDNLMPQIGIIGWKRDKESPDSWLAHLPYKESSEEKLSNDIKETISMKKKKKDVY